MSDIRLSVRTEDYRGVPLIRATGEIDLYTTEELRRAIQAAMPRGSLGLIVDLTAVSYMDSSGLTELQITYKALESRGARLCVVAPRNRPGVYRVLEITRLNQIFGVYDSVADAARDLGLSQAA